MAKKKYNIFVSYIINHWKGNLSLAKSFWVNGFLLNIIIAIPLIYAELSINEISETAATFFLLYILFYIAYFIWVNFGIWKSAGKYLKKKRSNKIWGYGARVIIVFSVIRAVGESLISLTN